jgi:uncharacterized phiE125 gp8 family phage protein
MTAVNMTTESLVLAPAVEPLSIDEVKRYCGLVADDHNELLEGLISAATEYAQEYTHRAFIRQTWDLWLDRFPDGNFLSITRPPLIDVTWVKYLDSSGTLTEWDAANYTATPTSAVNAQQGRILRAEATAWPVAQAAPQAVTVRYRAGYGTTGEHVPMVIRVAMKKFIAEVWSARAETMMGTTSVAQQTAANLLQNYRSSWL